jgi:hypothetical protein
MDRDVRVQAGVARGVLTAHAPMVTMKSALWYLWARIAIEHEAEAHRHRAAARGAKEWNLLPEMLASMVATCAAAFAVSALHSELAPLIERLPDPRPRGKLWAYQRETYRLACSPSKGWQSVFEWLMADVRPLAVHFIGEEHESVPHPELPTNVSRETAIFTAESAKRAVDLVMNLFGAVIDGRAVARVSAWGEKHKPSLAQLTELRGETRITRSSTLPR